MSSATESVTNEALTALVSLSSLPPGARGLVKRVEASSAVLRHKLLSMGVVEGRHLQVTHIAPLGDPMTITALGYSLSLRKSEAEGVLVERC